MEASQEEKQYIECHPSWRGDGADDDVDEGILGVEGIHFRKDLLECTEHT